jgi:hypothetical protein
MARNRGPCSLAPVFGGHERLMRSQTPTGLLLGLSALGLALPSCGKCLHLPCPMPIAITINVAAAATGGPVTGAFVEDEFGGIVNTMLCSPTCFVPGTAGTYRLKVGAPGFQTEQRTVTVQGAAPSDCDCGTAITEHLDVALVPIP